MRIWGYVILVGLVIAAAGAASRMIYNAGRNSVIVQSQADAIKHQNDAIEAARLKWEETREAAEVVIVTEEKIVEKIRVVTKEVPKIVEKFIQPDCRDLGPEYAGVLNAAVRASNQGSTTETAAELDETL